MKTRTLLLLSLGCGLAIMLAGAVLLFQLTTRDDAVEPLDVGQGSRVGDMEVTVTAVSETEGELAVVVELGGTPDDAPADDFRLIASGRPVAVSGSTCDAIEDDDTSVRACIVTFDVTGADGSSRVLFYERGDRQARWQLA